MWTSFVAVYRVQELRNIILDIVGGEKGRKGLKIQQNTHESWVAGVKGGSGTYRQLALIP